MPAKVHIVKAMVFPVDVHMWELDSKKGWVPKNWCLRIVVLEETLESRLDCKEIKPVNPKGNQPWVFIETTDAKAEAPNFGHLMQRVNSLEKTLMLGKIEGRRREGEGEWDGWMTSPTQYMTEFEQAPGDGEEQGSLACYNRWGHRVRHNWATQQQLLLHFPAFLEIKNCHKILS